MASTPAIQCIWCLAYDPAQWMRRAVTSTPSQAHRKLGISLHYPYTPLFDSESIDISDDWTRKDWAGIGAASIVIYVLQSFPKETLGHLHSRMQDVGMLRCWNIINAVREGIGRFDLHFSRVSLSKLIHFQILLQNSSSASTYHDRTRSIETWFGVATNKFWCWRYSLNVLALNYPVKGGQGNLQILRISPQNVSQELGECDWLI